MNDSTFESARLFLDWAEHQEPKDITEWIHEIQNRLSFEHIVNAIEINDDASKVVLDGNAYHFLEIITSGVTELSNMVMTDLMESLLTNREYMNLALKYLIKKEDQYISEDPDTTHFKYEPVRSLTIQELATINLLTSTTEKYEDINSSVLLTLMKTNNTPSIEAEKVPYCVAEHLLMETISNHANLSPNEEARCITNLKDDVNTIVGSRTSFECPTRGYLSVDYTSTNATLEKEFKKWLLSKRKENTKVENAIKPHIENLFSDWSERKVLAIFDLNLWCKINNVSLNVDQYIELLQFNDDEVDSENFRNTYMSSYNKAFNWNTLDQLKSRKKVIDEGYSHTTKKDNAVIKTNKCA